MGWNTYTTDGSLRSAMLANFGDLLDVETAASVDGSLLRYEASKADWRNTTSATLLLSDAGQLQVPTTGVAGGLLLGGDANIYRSAANVLTTDDRLTITVAGGSKNELQITSTTANTGIVIGGDANLYRSAANILKTDDKIQQPTAPTVGDDLTNKTYVDTIYGASGAFVVNEVPSGTINGSNTAFTLANTPITGSVSVYLNGLRQKVGGGFDYTISGTTITFVTAPLTGSAIIVDYRK